MNNISSKLFGLFLIFMGVGYLGSQFDLWSFTIFFRGWWACLIVIVGICSMLDNGFKLGNMIVTGVGVYLFLAVNDYISFRITFQVVVAAILVLVGLKLLFFRDCEFKDWSWSSASSDTFASNERNENKNLFVHSTFSTRRVANEGALEKCRVENVFGTIFLDLSNANLRDLDRLSVECIFGNIEILLPAEVNLNVKRENVFGACYADITNQKDGYSISVKETCIFGTIRITKARK